MSAPTLARGRAKLDLPSFRASLTLAVLAAWLVSGQASATTTLNGQGFCYWPVATTVLDVQSGGQGSARAVSVNGTGHVEEALLDSMFDPCDPPKLTRDCTASATATLDYGLVAADMTAEVSYAPDTYVCPDGSSGDTIGAAAAIDTRFNGEFRDSVTVTSSTLAAGAPVQVLATISLDAAGSASGTTIPYGTPSYGPNVGIALRLDVDDGLAQVQIYGSSGAGPLVLTPGNVASVSFPTSVGATVGITGTFTAVATTAVGPVGGGAILAGQAALAAGNTGHVYLEPETADVTLVAASGHDYAMAPEPSPRLLSSVAALALAARRMRGTLRRSRRRREGSWSSSGSS